MPSESYIMSIDVGTQSTRAVVLNPAGQIIANERLISEPYYSLQPGWAEVKAESVWENVCLVTRRLADQMGGDIKKIKACGVTANRDNIVALDEDSNCIRDWLTWLDKRTTDQAIDDLVKTFTPPEKIIYLTRKSCFDSVISRSKFNWFKYNEAETHQRAKRYCTMSGLLTQKLTGKFHDSVGMQSGILPFEAKKFRYYEWDFIYKILGVRREQLADKLFQSGEIMGYVTEEAAEASGLPRGLPIVATGGDKQCEALGSGALSENEAVISYGTMAVISLISKKYLQSGNLTFYTFPSTLPEHWNLEFDLYTGYWLVSWFCKHYALEQDYPEFLKQMNREAADIPAGSNGVFVYPYWASQPELYPCARGSIIGLTDRHQKANIFRALLEGVAYSLKDGLNLLQKNSKEKVRKIYVVGGGSNSDVAMQMTADVFNIPCIRLKHKEVCAIGAAIPAGVAVGIYENFGEAVSALVEEKDVFAPIEQNVKVYNDIYDNIYDQLYKKNEPIFRLLRKYEK